MTYSHDITTECELDGYEAPVIFSVYENDAHPDDLPSLTLETVQLGQLWLTRDQVIAWVGNEAVARIERMSVPEDWNPAEDAACERADAWRKENMA
jgi:hypothetical protein